jgi:hypothetical protein
LVSADPYQQLQDRFVLRVEGTGVLPVSGGGGSWQGNGG